MNLRTTMTNPRTRDGGSHRSRSARHSPSGVRRSALLLAAAACGAVTVPLLTAGEPAAHAGTGAASAVAVSARLGLTGSTSTPSSATLRPLQQLTASRAERGDGQSAASSVQVAADQKALQALADSAKAQQEAADRAAAEAAAKAAADAAAKAAAEAQAQAAAAARNATPSSFRDYAQSKLGGDPSQFSCLQSLWGKESGWNPNAQNPGSTAYGIPQFLDSTWAGTGIAKTSDGYRQIDAGLIYIDSRYGSPCAAWAHSRGYNWY
jgi:hypothetical protein